MKKPQDVFSAELLQWTVVRRRCVSLLYPMHRQARCLFSDFKSTAYPVNKIRRRKLMNPQIQQALCNSVQGYIMEYKITDARQDKAGWAAGHVCTAKVFTWAGKCIFSPEDTWKCIKCTDLPSLRKMQGSREILSFYCICVSFKCVQNIPKTLNRDSFSKSINAFCYHY